MGGCAVGGAFQRRFVRDRDVGYHAGGGSLLFFTAAAASVSANSGLPGEDNPYRAQWRQELGETRPAAAVISI